MRTTVIIAAACAAALAFGAPASANESQAKSANKEKQAQEEKKICKWLSVTGSNRPERHCLTKEDWKKAEALSW